MKKRAIGGSGGMRAVALVAGLLAGTALLRADGAGEEFPAARLTNWDGGAVTLPIAGKASIVAYTYARCVYGCPLITQYLKELDAGLGRPDDIRYVHVSVNPAGDTPGEIRKHFAKFGIDPENDPRWLFLTGPPESIDSFLSERGIEVRRRRLPAGELIEHTIRVDVVGRRGRIAATFDTYLWDKESMHDAVRRSLAPR